MGNQPINAGFRKYGVAKSQCRLLTQNIFHIPLDYQDLYHKYYLLFWTPDYFYSQVHDGMIQRDGVDYQVIYHLCTPTALRKYAQVRLSFRIPQQEYEIEPYVLVGVQML